MCWELGEVAVAKESKRGQTGIDWENPDISWKLAGVFLSPCQVCPDTSSHLDWEESKLTITILQACRVLLPKASVPLRSKAGEWVTTCGAGGGEEKLVQMTVHPHDKRAEADQRHNEWHFQGRLDDRHGAPCYGFHEQLR